MEKQEIEYLKTLGFWQESENNPLDILIFRLDIQNHPLLSRLHILVTKREITVWCMECGMSNDENDTCIAFRKYNRKTLEGLIHYLS